MDGTFSIQTDDEELLGMHELHIQASLPGYPGTQTAKVVVPLQFIKCAIELGDWIIDDVIVPTGEELSLTFDEPNFS